MRPRRGGERLLRRAAPKILAGPCPSVAVVLHRGSRAMRRRRCKVLMSSDAVLAARYSFLTRRSNSRNRREHERAEHDEPVSFGLVITSSRGAEI